MLLVVIPLPSPERTPPVTTTYFVCLNGNRSTHPLGIKARLRRCPGGGCRPPGSGGVLGDARLRATVPVTGVQLRALEARRYQDPQARQAIRIDHNSHIALVQATDDGMRVEFGYTTSYGALGVVKVEGVLGYKGDDAAAAAEQWGKDRTLPQEVAQQVHGAIMSACVPQAVSLAKDIRMPPPIPLPQVRIGKPGEATASSEGPAETPEVG